LRVRLYFLILFLLSAISIQANSISYPLDFNDCEALDTTIIESSDSIVKHYLQRFGVTITNDNKVKILSSGRDKFNDMFAAIRQAKKFVHLEYFNFRNDSIAGALFDLLSQKVAEGVQVRAIFDDFGNWSNNQPLRNSNLRYIRHNGIEIYKFDPIKFPYINHVFHRDHRKIVVIDGLVGYTGGMNVADYYINGLPEIGPWHDMHLRIEGSAVNDLEHIFSAMWEKVSHHNIDSARYYTHQKASDDNHVQMAIVDRTPRKSPKLLRRTFVETINAAQQHLRIINPYFVPTTSIRKALKRALKRGVNVEIMMSAKADIPFTPEASLHILHKLMKQGAKVYLYNGGFHHTKVMTIDERFCTVGTANLNSRSLRFDYEDNAYIFDKGVTSELNSIFERDEQHCVMMSPEYWKKLSLWKKFVCNFAYLFTPVL
jgi:cardiolipin synthase